VRLSNTHFDPGLPFWQDYLPCLQQLSGPDFPDCEQLNALLADNLCSAGGSTIRFVPSTELDDGAYEHRIYTSGQVSTRPGNWHDLFNALVWMRFPRTKVAMNSLHFNAPSNSSPNSRGALRDALTLFDESGAIVFSQNPKPLEALAQRQWAGIFENDGLQRQTQYLICGHAMLEKYLSPYKAMTAKALLIIVDADAMNLPRALLLAKLDNRLAELLLAGKLLTTPACLTPLPLAGIPGWWPGSQQDHDFYADKNVFRPAPPSMTTVPIIEL
jgi:hypothetical protein